MPRPKRKGFEVRRIEAAVFPCFEVAPTGGGSAWVRVTLPAHPPARRRVYEERLQLAETVCRILNGELAMEVKDGN